MLLAFHVIFFYWPTYSLSKATSQFGPTLKDSSLVVETVVTGLSNPTAMAFLDAETILVLQKNDGNVRRVQNGVLQQNPVLNVAVNYRSERGLLGVALDPNDPYIYLYYTESSTGADTSDQEDALGNRVYRYTWDGEVLKDPHLILDLPFTNGPNHDGGIVLYGPDDKLYVVIGDLNRNGQLQNFENEDSPDDTSVIFRVNPDGTASEDNPFFNSEDLSNPINRYYAFGIRNSFGMAFDPETYQLWDTENGPSDYDEINLVAAGFNSGWESIMGPDARDSKDAPNDLYSLPGSMYSDPEFSWGYDAVGVTSLAFHTSTRLGDQYTHDIFVGDTNEGYLYHFELNEQRDGLQFSTSELATDLVADSEQELEEVIFGEGFGTITDIETGPDGCLYICSYRLGAIFRIRSIFKTVVHTTTKIITTDSITTQVQTITTTIILPELFSIRNGYGLILILSISLLVSMVSFLYWRKKGERGRS